MSGTKRKVFGAEFKAKVGLEAIHGVKTINQIAQENGVHPAQVGQWKKEIPERAGSLFEGARPQGGERVQRAGAPLRRDRQVENGAGLAQKKVRVGPVADRRAWIEPEAAMPVARQCELAGVSRATAYARRRPAPTGEQDLELLRLIDEQYTRRPFYGSRKMVSYLRGQGHRVNRKRVQRLMRVMGLAGMAPGPNTSRPHPQHKVYPYLLRGVVVERPNQVWSTDITYIRLTHGFVYLVAVIDWYSRKVLSWRISNTLDSAFCVDCLEEAMQRYGNPEIFNTDQGCQFTSESFTGKLKANGIAISVDGRGRALDNIFVERLWRSVKYEDVYLKGYANPMELMIGLTEYFVFYNGERPHQSLGNRTPADVYSAASGGGARIADEFSKNGAAPCSCVKDGLTSLN